jgi:hypothetical protein
MSTRARAVDDFEHVVDLQGVVGKLQQHAAVAEHHGSLTGAAAVLPRPPCSAALAMPATRITRSVLVVFVNGPSAASPSTVVSAPSVPAGR